MRYVLIALALSLPACATAREQVLPRTADALLALADAWRAVCQPPPKGQEQKCEDARKAYNVARDAYTAVNDAAKAAQ